MLPKAETRAEMKITSPKKLLAIKQPELREIPQEVLGKEITYENIFNIVNQERYAAGLKIYKRNKKLDKVANDKLEDILKYGYWDHNNPIVGTQFELWFQKEYYDYKVVGENLERNFSTVQEVIAAWMNSPLHKKNILEPMFIETGIAVRGNLVVQVFGSEFRLNRYGR